MHRENKFGSIFTVALLTTTKVNPENENYQSSVPAFDPDARKQIFTALPDIGQVVRIDPDGSQHVVDRSTGGWRVTAVATFGDSVFMLESSDSTNAGQRVRVLRGSGTVELLGQVEP